MKHLRSLLVSAALMPLLMSVMGCIVVPMRMRTLSKNSAGVRQKLPPQFPQAGTSTREQVEQQFREFQVDTGVPDLFLAQFEKSKWGVFFAAGGPGWAQAGGGRIWSTGNVLVRFDENGSAKTVNVLPEEKLGEWFATQQREGSLPPVDLPEPLKLEATHSACCTWGPVSLTATLDELRISASTNPFIPWGEKKVKPPKRASLSWAEVQRVSIGSIAVPDRPDPSQAEPSRIYVDLRFNRKTEVGKRLRVLLRPSDAFLLVRLHEQQHSPAVNAPVAPVVPQRAGPQGSSGDD